MFVRIEGRKHTGVVCVSLFLFFASQVLAQRPIKIELHCVLRWRRRDTRLRWCVLCPRSFKCNFVCKLCIAFERKTRGLRHWPILDLGTGYLIKILTKEYCDKHSLGVATRHASKVVAVKTVKLFRRGSEMGVNKANACWSFTGTSTRANRWKQLDNDTFESG